METLTRIQSARKRAGLSRQTLAARLGVRQSTIWRWEHGKRYPGLDDLEAISLALAVPIRSLLVKR